MKNIPTSKLGVCVSYVPKITGSQMSKPNRSGEKGGGWESGVNPKRIKGIQEN